MMDAKSVFENIWFEQAEWAEWRVKLTLMTNEAIFFPLYSTILHSWAVGSDDGQGGGDRDLKLKHNYSSIHVKLDTKSH